MSDPHPDEVVTIVVVRTGGLAGLRRRWRVDAGADDADRWILLVRQCPWDAPEQLDPDPERPGDSAPPEADPHRTPDEEDADRSRPASERAAGTRAAVPADGESATAGAADRFVWSIRARTPELRVEQEVPEQALVGPWRELVEAVRSAT
ncbi:hypothetical protein [Microbacterium sp. CIAB417]|uniref:hypothetical protein n=1 Tax=Microbacterium sp. CIAB417 TaxID=2860287 RepID=UPI001FADFAB0|nr:hypothetical protein [Microbacterium sp. CIAB417]